MSYVIGKSVKIFRWTQLIAVDTKENSNVIGFYYIHIIEIPSNMGASLKKKSNPTYYTERQARFYKFECV